MSSFLITRNTYVLISFRTDVNTKLIEMSRAKIYRNYPSIIAYYSTLF